MSNEFIFPQTANIMAQRGLTLRDYFAAQAIQGMAINTNHEYYEKYIRNAYEIADMMLELRND